jgi:hypothetical protein
MKKPDDDIIRSISALSENQFWKILVQWFRDSLYEQAIANAHLTGELAIKGQGKVLELETLLKCIDNNRENLKAIRGDK